MNAHGNFAAKASGKRVYLFGAGKADGAADMKELLGGKGANLAEMASLGPAGAAGLHHHDRGLHRLLRQRPQAARRPEERGRSGAGRRSARRSAPTSATPPIPLLVSVRSGARASMPGMMDTILNLGLNDETVEGLAAQVGQRALRLRQLPPLHPDVLRRGAGRRPRRVRGHPREPQEPQRRLALDTELDAEDWLRDHRRLQGGRRARDRQAVPAGPARAALGRHRRRVRLLAERRAPTPTAACTASPTAGARPSTCRPWCSATWARLAPPASPSRAIPRPARASLRRVPDQRAGRGRGRRHPHAAAADRGRAQGGGRRQARRWKRRCPRRIAQLEQVFETLEKHYRDMQDIEFTIQDGKLWMLQTRTGKRTAEGRAQDRRRPRRARG